MIKNPDTQTQKKTNNMSNTKITFIAPAHNEGLYNRQLVNSLLAQTDSNWKCIVYHNGPNEDMKEWVESYKDSRINYEQSDMDTGQWGTQNRQTALTYIVDTPYVINTSIQDIYLPNAVAELNTILQHTDADMISWQAINHLFRYSVLSGEVAYGHIDWGQWCIRTSILKKVGIVKGNEFSSDWHTLQAVIATGELRMVQKLDKILTIHN